MKHINILQGQDPKLVHVIPVGIYSYQGNVLSEVRHMKVIRQCSRCSALRETEIIVAGRQVTQGNMRPKKSGP
jgi:hypothetical protein